ncbi:YdcH family protein [Plasticicumulans acidivorans]|uniref:DUF465 domain-containing protein n=1 Tax=Plasticicumulans acidivorans TaxID=886464 RepID=A0A317N2N9_9GAMM|nr:DUF465 domain-containing protein [Plasticicumulans acidivorans]PWV64407.1 hypothetical protein C7443_10256 [Plasticicumulans acidivorans]
MLTEEERQSLEFKLASLRQEHRDLDDVIERLHEGPYIDQMQITRMKKRKLGLKETITKIEDQLIPNIIA